MKTDNEFLRAMEKLDTPVFTIVIPAFNNKDTIFRAVDSVRKQTFTRWQMIVVDDLSTDGTREIIQELKIGDKQDDLFKVLPEEKQFNGGARNRAIEYLLMPPGINGYTLFLDADDEFKESDFFEKLYQFIIDNNCPDMIRLPYESYYEDNVNDISVGTTVPKIRQITKEKNLADVAHSSKVACWTKAVKNEKLVLFPENTLMEDVCQHIEQVDVCESIAWYPEVVVRWHIRNTSTSHSDSLKWQSSAWRFVADLMDLDLKHDYCRERRDYKVKRAKENLFKGISAQ